MFTPGFEPRILYKKIQRTHKGGFENGKINGEENVKITKGNNEN